MAKLRAVAAPLPRQIAVIHGPNLNLLGTREPEIYGSQILAQIDSNLQTLGRSLGVAVSSFQSNNEGEIVSYIQGLRGKAHAIVINAAAYTHTSIAIRDVLVALNLPFVEVHLSNIFAREAFRHHSYLSDVARGVIVGFGPQSYELGLRAVAALI